VDKEETEAIEFVQNLIGKAIASAHFTMTLAKPPEKIAAHNI